MRRFLKLEVEYEDIGLLGEDSFDIKYIIESNYNAINYCPQSKDIVIRILQNNSIESNNIDDSENDLLSSKLSKSIAITSKIKIL